MLEIAVGIHFAGFFFGFYWEIAVAGLVFAVRMFLVLPSF
jgi:hypothetical protein